MNIYPIKPSLSCGLLVLVIHLMAVGLCFYWPWQMTSIGLVFVGVSLWWNLTQVVLLKGKKSVLAIREQSDSWLIKTQAGWLEVELGGHLYLGWLFLKFKYKGKVYSSVLSQESTHGFRRLVAKAQVFF